MRIRITGSRVHRVWKCPASVVLPQVDDEGIDEPARDRGKQIHRYLERVGQVGAVVALSEQPKEIHPLLQALDLDELPTTLATEVAFAWNWRTMKGRELGRNLDRNYVGLHADEIPLTVDLGGLSQYGPVYIGDYKSGHTRYPSPEQFGQLLIGACAARDAWGATAEANADGRIAVLELIHIHDDGDHHRVRRNIDEWDLDAFAIQLRDAMLQVEYLDPIDDRGLAVPTSEGPWCDYCPAFKNCPAKVALVRSIPAELMAMGIRPNAETGALELSPGMLSIRNAAAAWMTLERISDVVARAKEEICGIAAFEEIPLPDGRVIGRLITERRAIDGKIGGEVLEKRYGRAERDKRVEHKLSIAAIQAAVVANIKGGEKIQSKKGDGVLDLVLKEIERLGGIGLNTTDSVKPHVPKKGRKP